MGPKISLKRRSKKTEKQKKWRPFARLGGLRFLFGRLELFGGLRFDGFFLFLLLRLRGVGK